MHRAGIKGWFTPWAVVHHVIPSERLTDKYLLQVARVMARGMAEDERATWGTAAFPFVWLARLGQLVGHFFPMWLWYRLCREGERAFGVRCRIEIARRHLADGFGLLLRADKRREESGRQAAEGRQFCRRTKSAADIEGGQDGTRRRNSLEQGITLVRPGQLSPVQLQQWSELADRQPDLSSPCFRPEFTLAVNEVRRDVEVAVVSTMGRAVAFFPFQRGRWKTGRPVGATLSDFQGVISEPGVNISQADLLRGCRLSGWKFDHLLLSQSVFAAGSSHRSQSPFIDISCGYEAYRSQLKQAGSRQLEQIERKLRKMEREAGPVRFEAHTNDPHVLRQLFDWKSQQYRRTGARDVFARQWPRDLLRRTLEFHEPAFSGMLSALYVGDKLAAVHFGMRSHGVLHWWCPAYNGEFHQYSPGLLLLLSLLTRADVLGITRIDLGKGDERYKLSLMTGSVSVGEGYASHSSWRSAVRATVNGSREWLRGSCLYRPARRSISCFRSIGNRVPFIEG
jgi:CelD/BcsL family acetyltransferase involved in cellulose biosynthesis